MIPNERLNEIADGDEIVGDEFEKLQQMGPVGESILKLHQDNREQQT